MESVISTFETKEQMTRVKAITDMNKRTFCVDYHCSNLLVFHYSQKQRIANHKLVQDHHLYLQDKSSCVAAHTVRKLLTKKDNICLTYVSGGKDVRGRTDGGVFVQVCCCSCCWYLRMNWNRRYTHSVRVVTRMCRIFRRKSRRWERWRNVRLSFCWRKRLNDDEM